MQQEIISIGHGEREVDTIGRELYSSWLLAIPDVIECPPIRQHSPSRALQQRDRLASSHSFPRVAPPLSCFWMVRDPHSHSCNTSSINCFSSAVGCLSFIPNVGALPSMDAVGSIELPPRDAIVRTAEYCVVYSLSGRRVRVKVMVICYNQH